MLLRHIRCRITANLRATATVAFLPPTFLASRVPQAFSADQRETRFSRIPAASNRYVRSNGSPHLEIRPLRSISPD